MSRLPMFKFGHEEKIEMLEQQLAKANERVVEIEWTLKQILGWRELRETPNFPIDRIEDLCREQLRKEQE